MRSCSAVGCSHSNEDGYIMKVFPKDAKRRLEWEIRVKRANWKPTQHSYLCQDHFTDDSWEKVRVDGTRKLKLSAVPTIFPHIVNKCKRKSHTKGPSPKKRPSTKKVDAASTVQRNEINRLADGSPGTSSSNNELEQREITSPGQEVPERFLRIKDEPLSPGYYDDQPMTGIGTVDIKEEHEDEENEQEEVPINFSFANCPVKSESAEESPVLKEHNYCNVIADSDGECSTASKLECFTEPWPELDPLSLAQEPGVEAQLAERRDAETISAVPQQSHPRSVLRNHSAKKSGAGAGNYNLKSQKTIKLLKNHNYWRQQMGNSTNHTLTNEKTESVSESSQKRSKSLAVDLQDSSTGNCLKQAKKGQPFKVRKTIPTNGSPKPPHSRNRNPLQCFVCKTVFATDVELKSHMLIHSTIITDTTIIKPRLQCSECDKIFLGTEALKFHLIFHKEDSPYKCGNCSEKFPDAEQLRQHMTSQKRPFKCGGCYKSFLRKSGVKAHCKRSHLKDAAFKCAFCGTDSPMKCNLDRHKIISVCNQPSIQSRTSNTPSELKGNVRARLRSESDPDFRVLQPSGETRFKCSFCLLTFTNEWLVALHIRECRSKPEDLPSSLDLPFNCGTCDKTFEKKKHLQAHYMMSHWGDPELTCNVCDMKFAFTWQLKAHATIHKSLPFKYRCGVCGYETFRSKNDLRRHLLSHVEGNLSDVGLPQQTISGR